MKQSGYLVRLKLDDVIKTDIWTTEKPMGLGYGLPYRLYSKDNRVYIQHKEGKVWEIKESQISEKSPILIPNFKESLKEDVFLRLERIDSSQPFYRKSSDQLGPLAIVERSGRWIHNSHIIRSTFIGKFRDEKLFKIKRTREGVQIKPLVSNLILNGKTLQGFVTLSNLELRSSVLRYKSTQWSFQIQNPKIIGRLPARRLKKEQDQIDFGKALGFTTIFTSIAILITLISGDIMESKENEIKEEDFAKIVLPKRVKTEIKKKEESEKLKDAPIETEKKQVQTKVDEKVVNKDSRQRTIQPDQKVKPVENTEVASRKRTQAKPTQDNKKIVGTKRVVKKKKPVSQAVIKAKKLKSSLSGLIGNKNSLLLSRSNQIRGKSPNDHGGKVPGVKAKSKLSAAPLTRVYDEQNVEVGYSDGGGDAGGSGVSYRSGYQGTARVGSGKSFVSIGNGGFSGRMQGSGLTKKEVFKVINDNITEVRNCYEKAILRLPNTEGKLVLGFTIGQSGNVGRIKVVESSIKDKPIHQCIMRRLSSWKFPRPKGNTNVDVQYPFIFRRL